MRPVHQSSWSGSLLFALLAAIALFIPALVSAQEPVQRDAEAIQHAQQRAAAFQLKREAIWDEARVRLHEGRERAELVRRAKAGDRRAIRALKAKPAIEAESVVPGDLDPRPRAEILAQRTKPLSSLAVPTNVQCNSTLSDGTSAGQSETSIAAIGSNVVVAWNDGQGFYTGGDIQGYGWSNDGGATFTDGGNIPHPAAFPAWRWTSDPVMTVNEKTGDYYYCGLANADASNNAIAIARGRFTAGTFAFDSVFIVRTALNTTTFLDKQWIAADSSNGNMYVTNTTFTTTDQIDFYRSTNGGRTWSAAVQISAAGDNGNVQGSRPAVGPNGQVYVVWYAADPVTDEDDIRFDRSLDGGGTFQNAGALTPVKFNQQFGTGAPGFNRERGVNFPSIAVDRSSGPHRGRVYITWGECYHFLDDLLPTVTSAISKLESVETTAGTNDTPATATPFTIGQVLRGALTSKGGTATTATRDNDYWSFPMTAGQHVIVFLDSVTASRGFTCRLFAPDGVQREQYAGKPDSTSGSGTVYYTFTAPASGTYYLRLAGVTFRSLTYRVRTRFGVSGAERGRDQRDGFAAWSDDGQTWAPANVARMNDDGIGSDNFLPEVTVGADGMPYASWFDHRDDLYGTRAHIYMSRSADGGVTWAANQRITDAQSNFTTSGTNIAPNLGDYQAIGSSGTRIGAAWGDGRSTAVSGVDTWSAGFPTTSDITTVPNDTTMTAAGTAAFGWTLLNANTVFGGTYTATWSVNRNWPLPAAGLVNLAAGSSAFYSASLTVPDTAKAGVVHACLTLTTPGGVVVKTSCFAITVIPGGALAVGPSLSGFALAPAAPNPSITRARIAYSLPRAGAMSLAVYDLAGARVRTLVEGAQPAGPSAAIWDGRDASGSQVRAGAYFYRLEFEGRSLTQRMVMMR